MILADQIRDFVDRHYITPARRAGQSTVTITAGDIHRGMSLTSRAPAVCAALKSKALQRQCAMVLIKWDGPPQGMVVHVTYSLEAAVPPVRSAQLEVSAAPGMTVDELAQTRRNLLRLLNAIERRTPEKEGLVSRVTRLSRSGAVPREIAALMKVVAEMRNALAFELGGRHQEVMFL